MNKPFIFLAGFGIGFTLGWAMLRKRYEELAKEEIDSVKQAFLDRQRKNEERDKEAETNLQYYAKKVVKHTDYSQYSRNDEKKKGDVKNMKPYVISEDEFGENDEYEQLSLMYYSDGTITDENDLPISDVEELIGNIDKISEYFNNSEEDSIFVRNDALKSDFEILRDEQPYGEG